MVNSRVATGQGGGVGISEERIKELWNQAVTCYSEALEEYRKGRLDRVSELVWKAVEPASRAICLRSLGRETTKRG
jgi:hypothetical protein